MRDGEGKLVELFVKLSKVRERMEEVLYSRAQNKERLLETSLLLSLSQFNSCSSRY